MKRTIKKRGRYLKGAALGRLGFCTGWAVDVRGHGQEWIEVVEVDLRLKNLCDPFRGKRIVHVSDLHCSRTVSTKYLKYCIDRINLLEPDIVVLTGDYVTHDYYGRYSEKVVALVCDIRSRLGVYACLGNHDYGVGGVLGSRRDRSLRQMVEGIESGGVTVLRNQSSLLEIDGRRLWLVGLGDLWAGDFQPERAFAGVGDNGAVIALAHNPETLEHLHDFNVDMVMCGHTHGGQVEWTAFLDRPVMNRRSYYAGMYKVRGKMLYVNRGLGRHGKAIFNTRPEITVFSLC